MSAFGSATMNINGTANNQKIFNETNFGDPRRSGNRKKFPVVNGGTTKKTTDQKRNKSQKRFDDVVNRESTSSPDPLDRPTKVIPRQNPGKFQSYSQLEITSIGNLFPNPEQLGFHQSSKSIRARPVPKYLLPHSRLLHTPPFIQNQWDKENQTTMAKMEADNSGKGDYQGLYETFQKLREVERKKMEELGLVDAENIAKDLNDAISFQGSCLEMCPVFERVRRQLENNVKDLERDPITKKISREKAVKAFSRPAAGQPPPLPSEVRPPHILVKTLDYLIDNVIDHLPEAHSFIWDRTRSIRQDFTYQNSFGPEAIDCNERIVRIHLLCLHIMAGSDVEYSQQQELEQLNKALQTLMEIYSDVRNNGGTCPNEAEFRAYHLLSHIRDPELEREIQNLPNEIYNDYQVQLALQLRNLISQNNIVERGVANTVGGLNLYVKFFRMVVHSDIVPFLMSCLLETQFNEIRFYVLKSMTRSYHSKGKPYSAQGLCDVLCFDNVEQVVKFVNYYDIDVIQESNGQYMVDLFNKEKLEVKYKLNSFLAKPKPSPFYSDRLNLKIKGFDWKHFINSGKPNNDLRLTTQPKIITQDTITKTENIPFQEQPTVKKSGLFQPFTNVGGIMTPTEIKFGQAPRAATPDVEMSEDQSIGPTTIPDLFPSKIENKSIFGGATFGQNKVEPKEIPKPKPMFQFGKPSVIPIEKPPISIPVEKENVQQFPPKVETPAPPPVPQPKVVKPPTPEPVRKRLVDSPYFAQASKETMTELISNLIDTELINIITKSMREHSIKRERSCVIEKLRDELYEAFLSEVIYETTAEAKAIGFYNRCLTKRVIRQLVHNSEKLLISYQERQRRAQELESVSFGQKVHTVESSNKRPLSQSTVDIEVRQREVQELWAPINLESFIKTVVKNMKYRIDDVIEMKFLLVVENWSVSYSKWLNSKLELKPDSENMVYENVISDDSLSIKFTSLPSNQEYLTKDFFSNIGFILFECGLTCPGLIEDKLQRDYRVLRKIISFIDKYSFYKVHVMVVFWDVSQSGIYTDKVSELLNLGSFNSCANLANLILCDMTLSSGNINNILSQAFIKIGNDFDGKLTSRGTKKKMLLDREKQQQKQTIPYQPPAKIQKIETKMLNQVKNLRKYDYLQNHINSTRVNPNMTTSFNNTSMISNVQNRSLLPVLIRNVTNANNSTFFNTTISTIGHNDTSLLRGFGQGMIGASTPSGSPKRSKTIGKSSLSNSLSQLKELTAGVKKKYSHK
ncbi:Nuclear mRNA export protein SAC3 [Spathaspora sp. JA1]|nr:Nuclear mRNA export protein SAC3 [Spathaspora sp. JA1]